MDMSFRSRGGSEYGNGEVSPERTIPDYAMETFDWNGFLKKEVYSLQELIEATWRSGDWLTCACGEHAKYLTRGERGRPKDRMLSYFGQEFHEAIGRMVNHWREGDADKPFRTAKLRAVEVLSRIRDRSVRLMEEEHYGPIL